MRERGSGTIVNISSMGGRIYTPLGAWYHATKHALEGWSDCLRIEVEPLGIDVVIVEPGLIETEFAEVVAQPLYDAAPSEPYRPIFDRLVKNFQSGSTGSGSPPSVIAETIHRAITARRPKTRYVVGKFARPMIAMRRLFGDRAAPYQRVQAAHRADEAGCRRRGRPLPAHDRLDPAGSTRPPDSS